MGAVQKAVFRLNEPAKLETFLRDLGRSHTTYGAKCEYMDVSARVDSSRCLINAIWSAAL
jgi:hypothetical protein